MVLVPSSEQTNRSNFSPLLRAHLSRTYNKNTMWRTKKLSLMWFRCSIYSCKLKASLIKNLMGSISGGFALASHPLEQSTFPCLFWCNRTQASLRNTLLFSTCNLTKSSNTLIKIIAEDIGIKKEFKESAAIETKFFCLIFNPSKGNINHTKSGTKT